VARLNRTETRYQTRTQGRLCLARRVPTAIVSVITASFLAATLVYACSGGDFMRLGHPVSSLSGGMVSNGPCNETRQDVCKSVRDRMLSIQASPPQAGISSSATLVISPMAAEVPRPQGLTGTSDPSRVSFLPARKRSLFLSYSILQI